MATSHKYEFNVTMSCGGCSGAIDRSQGGLQEKTDRQNAGVESYEVSLENQTATVVTALPFETVLDKISKTGKKVNSARADGVEMTVKE
ncbi:hypothetical protein CDD80_595 [Ophiocordyceps camponoti-rufipedis]|uniref:HMA domain-containing protein n=1 Tax=Ophiocordyceps camponoti-rufipedis TaxID=2004952 RepID=A0A2C5XP61_9HYPO|nr:hypothetical protein CDD80_595 [Ophiocordyceps camponoti-rufipedis]